MARVLVIGAGPAGSVFSARMAQLGHDVCVVERAAFPRRSLGESLSAGVLPLLDMIGGRLAVERAGFTSVRSVSLNWNGHVEERTDPTSRGLLVDRGRFDSILLERARALGVKVLQPASVLERRLQRHEWTVRLGNAASFSELAFDFIADASGRTGLSGRRRRSCVRTVALYTYWRGSVLPEQPRIEAGADAWFWGVPLPDQRYNTLVFLDPKRLRDERGRPLAEIFRRHLDGSRLMEGCRQLQMDGAVRAIDATPYISEEIVTPVAIKIGDAALAIDPLSSSGVQKAIQTALSAAVVVNTLMRKPESCEAAMPFYRDTVEQASARHRAFAAAHYASVAARQGGTFWEARAAAVPLEPRRASAETSAHCSPTSIVQPSPLLEFVEHPCIDGDFVTMKTAIRHPSLDTPLAYLGGWELAPLLNGIQSGTTLLDVVRSWSNRVPANVGTAIAGWLLDHDLLVATADAGQRSMSGGLP
jgi:flavin-dependent dehydrogenase